MRNVELANIKVPDFGLPDALPTVPKEEYEARIEMVQARMHEWGVDFVAVYGDREHFANVAFLTGYDPRFEETLLVIGAGQKPILLVGNEGMNYSRVSPLDLDRRLYQSFSLMAQDRARSDPLSNILRECGITSRARVGVVGWKYFEPSETAPYATPAFSTMRRAISF